MRRPCPPGPDLAPEHLIAGVFDRLVLDPVHAFTVRSASAASRIDAYALGDGTHLWSTAVRGQVVRMLVDSGVLLVSADDTLALDAATGKVRWRQRSASLLGNAAGIAVVTTVPGVFGGLDIRTGEPRWAANISASARTVIQYEAGRPRIIEMADWYPDGAFDLRDPVTGLDGLSGWQPTDATLGAQAALWHRMPAGGALMAVHNGQTGLRLVVGRVSGWRGAPTCELNATFLACYGGEELAVWRLPAPV